jgi:hypothetical protein
VVRERLVSRLNSDSHGDEGGKIAGLCCHLAPDSLVVISISVSLVENLQQITLQKTSISVNCVQDSVCGSRALGPNAFVKKYVLVSVEVPCVPVRVHVVQVGPGSPDSVFIRSELREASVLFLGINDL